MADVSDPSELFDLELHEDDKAHDSDDDRIELDDVSKRICIYFYENKLRSSGGGSSRAEGLRLPTLVRPCSRFSFFVYLRFVSISVFVCM